MMRIAYLHQYFNTPSMSGGTRSYEMARRLVARGHVVDMITSDQAGSPEGAAEWRTTEEAGIRVHWYPVPYSNHLGFRQRIVSFAKFARAAATRAASLDSDVIFATSTPLTIAIPALFAKRRTGKPMVFEVRDLWPDVPIALGAIRNPLAIAAARLLERAAYRNAEHVVALSPDMRDGVLRQAIDPSKVTIIPNSCDNDLFDVPASVGEAFRAQSPAIGSRPLVVYTGTLGVANGVDYLVRLAAAAAEIDPEIRFLIVGSGKEEEKVRSLARELGVLDRTLFMMPPVAKEQMPAVLSAADLAVSLVINLPEMAANSANKVFDALAAGRPVAVNHGGWLGDLIRERGIGLVLTPGEPEASARAVVEALRDARWCRAARLAARRAARETFDRDRLASRLEAVLCRACGQPVPEAGAARIGTGRSTPQVAATIRSRVA